ncbi:MAG: hypothetical protein RI101_05610 [Nitrospira sp.]|jgi:hypothetical protein|nr:hypothetical protein [Nitrospira sp.]
MERPSSDQAGTLEEITEAASVAAARGEWNLVAAHYQRRETVLAQSALQPEALARVQALDREVAERARLAQAGVMSLLEHALVIRQRLQGLRQWNGGASAGSGTIEKHV